MAAQWIGAQRGQIVRVLLAKGDGVGVSAKTVAKATTTPRQIEVIGTPDR